MLFGGIWAAVGGLLTVVFGAVAVAAPPMLLGVGIAGFFLVAGLAILLWGLSGMGRDRALLERGELVLGEVVDKATNHNLRVNRQYTTRIEFSHHDRFGEEHRSQVDLFDRAVIDAHWKGQELPLLIDPLGRYGLVAPTLIGARFAEAAEGAPRDLRRPLPRHVSPSNQANTVLGTLALKPTLWPIKEGWWAALRRPARARSEDAQLEADMNGLRQSGGGVADAQVRWDAPFTIDLSAWVVSSSELDLNVTLRSSRADAEDRGVRFRVRLPQEVVDTRVPVQQTLAPFLEADDFARLWPAICYHAGLHGEHNTLIQLNFSESIEREEASVAPVEAVTTR